MPTIRSDKRDEYKREIGIKLKELKKNNPQELQKILSHMTDEQAEEILYDQEIWLRDNQWVDLASGSPIHLLLAGRGFGKAESVDFPIFSPNRGWIRFGDLEVGDKVYDENGDPCNVLATYDHPAGTFENYYRLYFDNEDYVEVCGEHLWNTWTHRDRKQYNRRNECNHFPPENWWNHEINLYDCYYNVKGSVGPSVKTTEEIIETFTHSSRNDLNHSVPTALPLKGSIDNFPIDPWLYGMWLGDGGQKTSTISCGSEDYQEFFDTLKKRNINYECSKEEICESCAYVLKGLIKDLKKYGLEDKDNIPEWVYHCSAEVRLDILKGLCDSDGHTDGLKAENTQKRKNIADLIHFLVVSLGSKAKMRLKKVKKPNTGEIGEYYRVIWTPTFQCFSYKRKCDQISSIYKKSQQSRKKQRMITHYEKIDPIDTRCITVDSESNLYLSGKSLIPTHNSMAGAATIKRAVENHGVKDILIIAVASRDFRATIAPAILDSYSPNDKNKPTHSVGKGGIFWPNGAVATCIPAEAGEDAVRGLNSELIWCDEPAFYGNNEGVIDQALLTLRREPSILIATTSPKATPKIIEWVERGEDPEDHMVKLYSGSTYENMENLSDAFIDTVIKKYEGTRMGDTELEGKLILTNDSALWQTYVVKRNTIDPEDLPPMREISIGIDPAMLNKKGAGKNARTPDSTGITVSGCDADGIIYTLEGHTGSYSAEQWVDKVCMLHDKYAPKVNKIHIVAEINVIGEEMLRMSFNKAGRKDVEKCISAVFATQSKIQRAMPYALLSEQDKVKFVDGEYLKLLSMEMTTYDGTGKSPNALDSAVWSWSKLQPNKKTYVQSKELLF